MVNARVVEWAGQCVVLLAAAPKADKLPPTTKAAAQMALLGIALVGLLFVVMILLGGHWARRQGTPRRGPVVPPDRAPLKPVERPRVDEQLSSEEE
jgi:hypothetical protein